MKKAKYLFGDIVVINNKNIGVIVKSWENLTDKDGLTKEFNYDVYVRTFNFIAEYQEDEIERYRIRHKYLDKQELEWQNN